MDVQVDVWTITVPRWMPLRWDRVCPHCNVAYLTNERAGFCCGRNGARSRDVQPLPPLPEEYNVFLNDPRLSLLSRVLNLCFSFSSMETTAKFPRAAGPDAFLAIAGRVYHRVRPNHANSGVRWMLYDGFERNAMPHVAQHGRRLPVAWTNALSDGLRRVNPFVQSLQILHDVDQAQWPEAHIVLEDQGTTAEIAALIRYDNTAAGEVTPRQLSISRLDGRIQQVAAVSRLWEPLTYPLLFPHATLGWGVIGDHDDVRRGLHAQGQLDPHMDAPSTQIWHYRARLLREPRFVLKYESSQDRRKQNRTIVFDLAFANT